MSPLGAGRRLPAVLIIDDDVVSREVMATVLSMSGYTVHTANSGAASLDLLASGTCSPEVILMDTQMPGISGEALIRELRAHSGAVLYAMSGSQVPAAVLKSTDGFLLKPFGPEALQRVLEDHCQEIESTISTSAPVLDDVVLAQWREMMPDSGVREIYATLRNDLHKRIAQLKSALESGNLAEVRSIGHAIKGGCGMSGAMQMAQLGAKLESGGDDLEYSRTISNDLRAALEILERMLDAEFPPRKIVERD